MDYHFQLTTVNVRELRRMPPTQRALGAFDLYNGVRIVGIPNLAATVPADASALYARNVLNFLALSLNVKTGEFAIPKEDEIVVATLQCESGQVVARKA